MAEHYGLADVREAEAYANDPRLRARLLTAASAALDQVRAGVSPGVLMGSEVDVLKLVSSMTLFGGVARRLAREDGNPELRQLADTADALVAAAERDGYRRCAYTERQLALDDSADG